MNNLTNDIYSFGIKLLNKETEQHKKMIKRCKGEIKLLETINTLEAEVNALKKEVDALSSENKQ